MRLMLVALGSRGDVVPALGLVPVLAAAGHEVTIAANPEFDEMVRRSGAGFVALPGDARTISAFPRGWRTAPRFLAQQASATPFRTAARRVRAALGLPARRREPRLGPVLHGWSPHVLPRPADWRPGLGVAGYWRPPVPPGWEPPAELVDFLDAGAPPVLIGFGSMAAGQDGWLSEVVADAVRGRRAIVQRGWAGVEASGSDVLVVGDVPHDWLLPRVAAVVHHGGAGTAGAVFSAGVPGVCVPVYADQPMWADRARRLGTGPAPLPFAKLTGAALAARVDAVTTSRDAPAYRAAATALAARIATDDPTGPVLAALRGLDRPG